VGGSGQPGSSGAGRRSGAVCAQRASAVLWSGTQEEVRTAQRRATATPPESLQWRVLQRREEGMDITGRPEGS